MNQKPTYRVPTWIAAVCIIAYGVIAFVGANAVAHLLASLR